MFSTNQYGSFRTTASDVVVTLVVAIDYPRVRFPARRYLPFHASSFVAYARRLIAPLAQSVERQSHKTLVQVLSNLKVGSSILPGGILLNFCFLSGSSVQRDLFCLPIGLVRPGCSFFLLVLTPKRLVVSLRARASPRPPPWSQRARSARSILAARVCRGCRFPGRPPSTVGQPI